MASDSNLDQDLFDQDLLECLKSLLYDLNANIGLRVVNARFLIQERKDVSWQAEKAMDNCLSCLEYAYELVSDAYDICRADLSKQSDGANK